MSTSKHIDIICVVVLLLALLVTGLFMNGEAIGITSVTDADDGDGPFTANDLNADWDRTNATQITLTGDGGSVKGDGAYIYDGNVHIACAGKYVLSGELADGSVIIGADGDDKIWILMDGVSLYCSDTAAILVEQANKVFLTLAEGTESIVSCGADYTDQAISSKIDGAIYARDDLTINGSGFLNVTAAYKHGIVCNDNLVIAGGHIEITAAQDGIHANDSAKFTDMDMTINAGDDGITVSNDDETAYIYIASGNISIPACYEGIEAIDITIAGGTIDIRPTDDGINANGQGSNSAIRISGGDITIINETGRDADGLDSNGSIAISGGNILISVNGNGGSYALDYGTENGGVCEISGGTVIAAGASDMAECFDASSEQRFIMYTTSNTAAGTTVSLKSPEGTVLLSETIPCSFSSVVISTPELQLGETCTIVIGDTEAEVTVEESYQTNGFGMGGMGQGGMFNGQGGRANQSFGNRPDTGNTESADRQLQDQPEWLDGNASGNRMPDGGFSGGDIPQKPDGNDMTNGAFPGLPSEDGQTGTAPDLSQTPPDLPNGDNAEMIENPPTLPDGETQIDSGNFDGKGFGNMQQPDDNSFDDAADSSLESLEQSANSTAAWIWLGISVIVLLLGLAFAIWFRHRI